MYLKKLLITSQLAFLLGLFIKDHQNSWPISVQDLVVDYNGALCISISDQGNEKTRYLLDLWTRYFCDICAILHDILVIFWWDCQAQFQLASPVPVELWLALSLIITTPTHPTLQPTPPYHPPTPTTHPRESRDAAWNCPYMVACLVIFGDRG